MSKKNILARLIYTACGLGLIPKAPGTFGTLMGVLIYFLLFKFSFTVFLVSYFIICIVGYWATVEAEKQLSQHDSPKIVIDEVIGYLTVFILAPPMPWLFIWAFVLFRIFDILKPWPVSYFDKKVKNALGVILDDVAAGLYTVLVLHIIVYLFFNGSN